MRKFIFGVITIIVAGIVVVSVPQKQEEKAVDQVDTADEEIGDSVDVFRIETLSDKDIYFKADTALPDNPVINDMVDVANGYAILRVAYCDAELWFRFGGVVNDTIGMLKSDVINDKGIRAVAKRYVTTLVDVLSGM